MSILSSLYRVLSLSTPEAQAAQLSKMRNHGSDTLTVSWCCQESVQEETRVSDRIHNPYHFINQDDRNPMLTFDVRSAAKIRSVEVCCLGRIRHGGEDFMFTGRFELPFGFKNAL